MMASIQNETPRRSDRALSLRVLLLGAASSVHVQRWAWALQNVGHRVIVVSMHPGDIDGIDVRHVQGDSSRSMSFVRTASALKRIEREIGPNLVHAHYASTYGLWAARCTTRPVVISAWGSDVMEFPLRSLRHLRLLKLALNRADAVTTSGRTLAGIVKSYRAHRGIVESVPFGVDLDRFPYVDRSERVNPVRIGTARHLESVYGIDLLLESFAKVAEQLKNVELHIVGEGSIRAGLETLAGSLGITDRVTFIGELAHTNVCEFLGGLDIYCMPSRREGLPVAALEAAATGLPIVAFGVSGLREAVAHGQTGYLIPPYDITGFAEALVRLAGDSPLRIRLGAAARRHIEENFNWPDAVSKMCQIYSTLRVHYDKTQE